MTKEEFIAQLERGAVSLDGLPVSSAVLRFLAEDLKRGTPEWWTETSKAWERRAFTGWAEAWSLFLTALHFQALSHADCPLVPYFPSCGGTAEADPARGVVRFLAEAPDAFFDNLKHGERRAFFGPFATSWVPLASLFFQLRGLPFYIVEVGAGAGVHLAADLWGAFKLQPPDLVAARIGLDHPARALEDINDRRWLTASIFPDQTQVIGGFDQVADFVLDQKRRDPNFIQLVDCNAIRAPRFIAKNIPSDDPDVGLLIFNVGTTARLSDDDYKTYSTLMAELLKTWGERALWVELERVRGEMYSTTYETRVSRIVNGAPMSLVCGRTDTATGKVENYLEPTVRFLMPPNSAVTADQFIAKVQAAAAAAAQRGAPSPAQKPKAR